MTEDSISRLTRRGWGICIVHRLEFLWVSFQIRFILCQVLVISSSERWCSHHIAGTNILKKNRRDLLSKSALKKLDVDVSGARDVVRCIWKTFCMEYDSIWSKTSPKVAEYWVTKYIPGCAVGGQWYFSSKKPSSIVWKIQTALRSWKPSAGTKNRTGEIFCKKWIFWVDKNGILLKAFCYPSHNSKFFNLIEKYSPLECGIGASFNGHYYKYALRKHRPPPDGNFADEINAGTLLIKPGRKTFSNTPFFWAWLYMYDYDILFLNTGCPPVHTLHKGQLSVYL